MPITYTEAERRQLSEKVKGKVVKKLYWSAEEDGSLGYWVMEFEGGGEICFRLVAELES